jgi:hypothetical protein
VAKSQDGSFSIQYDTLPNVTNFVAKLAKCGDFCGTICGRFRPQNATNFLRSCILLATVGSRHFDNRVREVQNGSDYYGLTHVSSKQENCFTRLGIILTEGRIMNKIQYFIQYSS